MRKVFAIAAMGLLVLTLPAFAAVPATNDGNDHTMAVGVRDGSGECVPPLVVWDTGMYDEFVPPAATAFSAGCMVNADTTGTGSWPGDFGRRLGADDWLALDQDLDGFADPVTDIKVWNRVNAQAVNLGYVGEPPASAFMLHGFCVTFYEAIDVGGLPFCPDWTTPGEGVIGTTVYSEYCPSFVTWEVTTGLGRQYAYCITLPVAFYPTVDKWYWVSVSPDFDFSLDPATGAYSQMFWRAYAGLGISVCEAQWWDGWNYGPDAVWGPISVAVNVPTWAGFDAAFKLYSGTPPVATEPTTWGRIKANFR